MRTFISCTRDSCVFVHNSFMFKFIYAHDSCTCDDAYTRAYTCAYLLADGVHDGGILESAHVCMTHLYVSYSHVRITRVHVYLL